MGRPKKQKTDNQLPAPPSMLIDIDEVIETIKAHNIDVTNKIERHLSMVKQNAGDILPEDITYVLGLAQRELIYNFTSQRDA